MVRAIRWAKGVVLLRKYWNVSQSHCHGHSLSLSVKDATKNCKILSDTMDNTNEIVKPVKFSPKRDNILGDIKANLYYEGSEGEDIAGLAKFSATRWTVRAISFSKSY